MKIKTSVGIAEIRAAIPPTIKCGNMLKTMGIYVYKMAPPMMR